MKDAFSLADEVLFTTADVADYFQLLQKHYPALFSIPDLRIRLNLYHILHTLSSYVAWLKTQPELAKRSLSISPIAKLCNVLFDNGPRMIL